MTSYPYPFLNQTPTPAKTGILRSRTYVCEVCGRAYRPESWNQKRCGYDCNRVVANQKQRLRRALGDERHQERLI